MKVSSEKLGNSQLQLNIEVEPEELEKSLDDAYRNLAKKFNVPGFRKGRVPRDILENYLGKGALWEEAMQHLFPRLYSQVVQEQEIEDFAQPEVEIPQTDPLVFKVTVPLRPTVKLGDYRQIRLSPRAVEVKQEEVNAVMEQFRYEQSPWTPSEYSVSWGDMTIIDIERDAPEESPLKLEDAVYLMQEGSTEPMPGFPEQLVGMEKGQEKDFQLSFPDDHEPKILAGKGYHFKVKLKEVKTKQRVELNDEFARSLGEGVETIDALREYIVANLTRIAETGAEREFEQKLMDAVIDVSEVEFPPILVEKQIDFLLDNQANRFGGGQKGLETYLQYVDKSAAELREELRPVAARHVATSLVLEKLVEEEKVEVSPAEIDAEVEKLPEERREFLLSPQGRFSMEQLLLHRKAGDRLKEIATSPGSEDS